MGVGVDNQSSHSFFTDTPNHSQPWGLELKVRVRNKTHNHMEMCPVGVTL